MPAMSVVLSVYTFSALFELRLKFCDKWKEKADANPQWGQENPVSISVSRTETGDFVF